MSNLNLFEVVIVMTAFMLVASAGFAIVAPNLGVSVPKSPIFPSLPDLGNVQGNLSATFPFSQTKTVLIGENVLFNVFHPNKHIKSQNAYNGLSAYPVFRFQRQGTEMWVIPWSYDEPVCYLDGTFVNNPNYYLTPQEIVNNYNGTYSTFIIDNGNNQYMAYVSFSPLPSYSDMTSSWNSGHGFTAWMYGSAYQPPSWTDQLVAYLTWIGAIIAYFVYFVAYLISMASLMITVLSSPIFGVYAAGVGGAVIALVIIVFIGSLLMFIRGNGGTK